MSVTKSAETTPGHYQALAKDRLIFDSHGYVKRMTDGGFNEQQAEALAAEQGDLLNNLATRQDIDGVRDELGGQIDGLRDEFEEVKRNMATKAELEEVKRNMATKQDIALLREENKTTAATLKVEMIKWMTWYFLSGLAVMAAMMTALAAVLKLT